MARRKFSHQSLEFLDYLYRVAFHLAREPNEAQDLVQETYVRALESFQQFRPGTNLRAWLTRILYNFFLDHYHKKKRWVMLDGQSFSKENGSDFWEMLPGSDPGPEDTILKKELSMRINEALDNIPEDFRAPIVLVDMGEFSYAEAAEILSCPLGTIRSRLSRGRKHLQKHLKDYMAREDKKGRKQQK